MQNVKFFFFLIVLQFWDLLTRICYSYKIGSLYSI